MYLNDIMLDKLIMNALSEDVGTGDITTESTIPETARAHGLYKAKESGVLCGIGVAARVFRADRPRYRVHPTEARRRPDREGRDNRRGPRKGDECSDRRKSRTEPDAENVRNRDENRRGSGTGRGHRGRRSATRERRRPDSGSSKSTP